jgi:hypothetical protein
MRLEGSRTIGVEAYVLGNMSFLAMLSGNVREAVDILETARPCR